jgi:hypothetical protein
MNWTSKEKSKYWNKAYQEYSLKSGLSIKQVSDFIKINPFVALTIENKAIKFLKENKL